MDSQTSADDVSAEAEKGYKAGEAQWITTMAAQPRQPHSMAGKAATTPRPNKAAFTAMVRAAGSPMSATKTAYSKGRMPTLGLTLV